MRRQAQSDDITLLRSPVPQRNMSRDWPQPYLIGRNKRTESRPGERRSAPGVVA